MPHVQMIKIVPDITRENQSRRIIIFTVKVTQLCSEIPIAKPVAVECGGLQKGSCAQPRFR